MGSNQTLVDCPPPQLELPPTQRDTLLDLIFLPPTPPGCIQAGLLDEPHRDDRLKIAAGIERLLALLILAENTGA